ncbi:uncharacterized protein LOC116212901 [Punica granatum]|uniref:Uncharacterized protein n=2 Tax=Punica granatum TaxID=22663 RepID=A0A2I0JGB1_PUNGR|nr:uncharacterized protein LOC116212901 [Punica granatum]PKI55268.1 hypothetical protein CRG98_024284 [Punica granatum]
MLRTRLLWFGLGFTATAAAISQLVWRDLWVDRHALSSDMKQKFDSLEARVSTLESVPLSESRPAQVEG